MSTDDFLWRVFIRLTFALLLVVGVGAWLFAFVGIAVEEIDRTGCFTVAILATLAAYIIDFLEHKRWRD